MTLQFQIITLIAQLVAGTILLAGIIFLFGLVFEKQITSVNDRVTKYFENKKKEKIKQKMAEHQKLKEAKERKVQRIRDNFEKELEKSGTICVPYYSSESKSKI